MGLKVTGFQDKGATRPVSRVTLRLDDENVVTAGDDTGQELVADCAFATQSMADAILSRLKGYKYQMFTADAAKIDPAAELGDGVTVGGVYGVVSRLDDDGGGYPGIMAPGEAELEDEFPAEGPVTREFNRKIAQTRSYIIKTAEEIRLGVENELSGAMAEIDIQLDGITQRVEDAEGNIGTLQLTAKSLSSKVESVEGDISTLTQTANSLTSTIKSVQGDVSEVEQYAKSIRLSVSNGEKSSTLKLTAGSAELSSEEIEFTGMVTFSDLKENSKTVINGDYVKTGKIKAEYIDVDELKVQTIWGSISKVAIHADSSDIHIGGRNSLEDFSNIRIHGDDVYFYSWGTSSEQLRIRLNGNKGIFPANLRFDLGDSNTYWNNGYIQFLNVREVRASILGAFSSLGTVSYPFDDCYLGNGTIKIGGPSAEIGFFGAAPIDRVSLGYSSVTESNVVNVVKAIMDALKKYGLVS